MLGQSLSEKRTGLCPHPFAPQTALQATSIPPRVSPSELNENKAARPDVIRAFVKKRTGFCPHPFAPQTTAAGPNVDPIATVGTRANRHAFTLRLAPARSKKADRFVSAACPQHVDFSVMAGGYVRRSGFGDRKREALRRAWKHGRICLAG